MSSAHAQARETSRSTRLYRLLRLILHLLQGCVQVGLIFPFLTSKRRFAMIRKWSRQLLRIVHVRYTLHGKRPAGSPTFIVSNHVSWLDIWLINAVIAVRFVAKSDIRRWPLLGFLVKHAGTIFIERDKRRDTARTNRMIVQALNRGEYVAMFPEGTTTDGTEVKPYHASLFQPAVGAGATVAVLALRYVYPDGMLDMSPHYAGERTLVDSVRSVLRRPAVHAEIIFAGEVNVKGKTRRDIAIEAEQATARALRLRPPHRKPGTAGGHRV
jgi:1-acyl-sn-glycerol-3-phosphate acyltransferase